MDITVSLVKKLIAEQFSNYNNLHITPVKNSGHDHRSFHLGDNLLIRLPSAERYAATVEKEQKWLPILNKFLSVEIPKPIAMGRPSDLYPWNWSIYNWIEGLSANCLSFNDDELNSIAISLAKFLKQLHKVDITDAPVPGAHNFYRGAHLCVYSTETYEAISNLSETIDADTAKKIWETAISSKWDKKSVWVHGDFASGNLILNNNKLIAIIDFSCMCVGDPACDLVIAWTLLKGESRKLFKSELSLDKNTWARARGWALWKAMITLNAQKDKACVDAARQINIISELLNE